MEVVMELVKLEIKPELFKRLQCLAEPLVDDVSSVIERLITHWESCPPTLGHKVVSIKLPAPPTEWRSARGERFPIGAKLRARYLNHNFEAIVTASGIEFNGHTYNNPSSAGIAAKESVGTTGNSASTNGWDFWEILDSTMNRWVSIDVLRSKNSG